MLYPVEKLLANQESLICVSQKETVRDALTKMVKNDFSQLPVVDDVGNLAGIISTEIIARTYLQVNNEVILSDLHVHHCQERAFTLTPEADLFEALDLLQKVYAIVIVQGHKPIGILTAYDTTHFFRDITEGLLIVEDIETTLRQYIETILGEEKQMQAALMRAFKPHKQDGSRPAYGYDELNFHQHIQLITTEGNWSRFETFFDPKRLFSHYMNQVNQIRNQLAHFRDDIDIIQYDVLRRSRDWLANRPKPNLGVIVKVEPAIMHSPQRTPALLDRGKYAPLARWLHHQDPAKPIQVTLEQIESILGDALPPSALEHRSWWANDAAGHSQSRTWLTAGWRVDDVDLTAGNVTLRYTHSALYQMFFTEVVQRLREIRPSIGRIKTSSDENYCTISAGRSGFSFAWAFPRQPVLRVELYIDAYDADKNAKAFVQLETQKREIEAQVGAPLEWIPMLGKRASRICITHPTSITAPPEALAVAKVWAVETMQKFMDTFQPRIKEISLD